MRIPVHYHHHLVRVLLLETAVVLQGRRGICSSSFVVSAFTFPTTTNFCNFRRQHFHHRRRRTDGVVVAMDHNADNSKEHEGLAFTNVLNSNDMIEYYNKTKQILQRDDDDDNDELISTMNSKFLELRHKKSMMRCVLNNYEKAYSTNADSNDDSNRVETKDIEEVTLISKVEFQQRLRLIERRNKWNVTHQLLFGCDDNDIDNDQNETETENENGNNASSSSYWWMRKDSVIDNGKAPEFLVGIQEHYNFDIIDSSINTTMKILKTRNNKKHSSSSYDYETNEDPKRFLSRLARGRTYKGNFRNLLENIFDVNDSKRSLISLYDEIIGVDVVEDGEKVECGCDKEVQLLHSFVDELEREQQQQQQEEEVPMTTCSVSELDATAGRRLIVNQEQIDLLRMICNLNNNSNNGSSSSSNMVVDDDGGRSWGKRGESNLNLYLEERQKQKSTMRRLGESSIDNTTTTRSSLSSTMVLSPVWVRGKKKNRQQNNCNNNNDKSRKKNNSSNNNKKNNFNINNSKQRCQYVLEIPNTNILLSSGTTSEFDAMVVRTATYDNNHNNGVQKEQMEEQKPVVVALPTMIIEEVWDAKATLDPSALMDVLNKKVTSLQKILFHNYDNDNDNDDDDDGNSEKNREGERSTIIEAAGAKFVIFPDNNSKKYLNTKTAATTMPMVFQVGIGSNNIGDGDDSKINNDSNSFDDNDDGIKTGGCCQQQNILLLPQIGIFANRMFSPKSAARRIETLVYERLLETDIDTVISIIMTRNNNNNNNNNNDVENNGSDHNHHHRRHRRIIRRESMKITESIIRLIETIQPIVVIGDCK
jgi:hypothetical protein